MNFRHVVVCMAVLGAGVPFFARAESVTSTTDVPFVSVTSTDSVMVQTSTSTEPVILQMGDGRFYDPASGMIGLTREAVLLRLELNRATSSSSNPTISPSTTDVTSSPSEVPVPILESTVPEKPKIIEAVERAQALLTQPPAVASSASTSTKSVKAAKPKKPVSEPAHITVAIWDPVSDLIETASVPFKKSQMYSLSYERPLSSIFDAATIQRLNVNEAPDGRKIVAIRFPLVSSYTTAGLKHPEYVVYTPYSKTLNTPETVAYGKYVLHQMIEEASTVLRDQGVRSKVFPERLVTEVIDPNLVQSILMIEHSDSKTLASRSLSALEPFFVTIALNGRRAFGYVKSRPGASGIAQFMPATYKSLVKSGGLPITPEIGVGLRDAFNSIKAETIYLDRLLADLPASTTASLAEHPETVGAYVAAAYNGGSLRVRRAAEAWGEAWAESRAPQLAEIQSGIVTRTAEIKNLKKKIAKEQVAAARKDLKKRLAVAQSALTELKAQEVSIRRSTLYAETRDYVVKYRQVFALLTGYEALAVASSGVSAPSS